MIPWDAERIKERSVDAVSSTPDLGNKIIPTGKKNLLLIALQMQHRQDPRGCRATGKLKSPGVSSGKIHFTQTSVVSTKAIASEPALRYRPTKRFCRRQTSTVEARKEDLFITRMIVSLLE